MRGMFRALLAIAVLALAPLISPSAALAAGPCGTTVYDGAGVFKSDTSQVEQALKSLQDRGTDVHVVTTKTYAPADTLDAYIVGIIKHCPAWQEPEGNRKKTNLLIFAMSLDDRKVAIIYGKNWIHAFEDHDDLNRIQVETMKPKFHEGDFTGGFAAGMDDAGNVIETFRNPPPPPPVVAGPTTVQEATDYSGLWKVFGFIALGLFLLVLGFFLVQFLSQRQADKASRQSARRKAMDAKQAVVSSLTSLDVNNRQTILKAKDDTFGNSSDPRSTQLHEAYTSMLSLRSAVSAAVAARTTADADMESDSLTAGDYETIADNYASQNDKASQALADADTVDRLAAELKGEIDGLSKGLEDSQVKLADLRQAIDGLKSAGYHTQALETGFAAAQHQVGLLEGATGMAGVGIFQDARLMLDNLQGDVEELQVRQAKILTGIAAVEDALAKTSARVPEAAQVFDRMSTEFAKSSWESVVGNGSNATARLQSAKTDLAEARALAGMFKQDWAGAEKKLASASTSVERAKTILGSIIALSKSLEEARLQAPREIDEAAADIARAESSLDQFESDLSKADKRDLRDDLARGKAGLDEARSELAKDKPNFLRVVDLALAANAAADAIYATCVQTHEAAERQRSQAASTLAQAKRAVSEADEYLSDHESRVKSTCRRKLKAAQTALESAVSASSSEDVISYATTANATANDALRSAKANVAAVRAAEASSDDGLLTGMVIGSSMNNNYNSNWGNSTPSSTPSIDWGSSSGGSSDGGGSSIDFGGGGGGSDGGGSSNSW